jgi:hypothetical protein
VKTFVAVVENPQGIVVGAHTWQGTIELPEDKQLPREQLAAVALTLATKYGVDPASFTLPAGLPSIPPPPAD